MQRIDWPTDSLTFLHYPHISQYVHFTIRAFHYPYILLSVYLTAAAAAHKVNVRYINSKTVGISFGEAITRADTEALLAGKSETVEQPNLIR